MAVTTPQIIAHRGASRERPENSLAAFERAAALGADGVELDVHRTADGVIVVHHDPAFADGRAITEVTAAQVAALLVRGEPIPTLSAVFDAIGRRLDIYCELKGRETAAGTLALIRECSVPGRAHAVHAFDHRQIAEARRTAPLIPRGVLEVSYPVDPLGAAADVDARDLWRHVEYVDEALVRAAHAAGRRVIAWTVNDPALMARFAAFGVDALCTDDVALAKRTLGR